MCNVRRGLAVIARQSVPYSKHELGRSSERPPRPRGKCIPKCNGQYNVNGQSVVNYLLFHILPNGTADGLADRLGNTKNIAVSRQSGRARSNPRDYNTPDQLNDPTTRQTRARPCPPALETTSSMHADARQPAIFGAGGEQRAHAASR